MRLRLIPSADKSVENTTPSVVFRMNFVLFGNVMNHCLGCLWYVPSREKSEEKTGENG